MMYYLNAHEGTDYMLMIVRSIQPILLSKYVLMFEAAEGNGFVQ